MAETITLTDLSCCCDTFVNSPCDRVCCSVTLPTTLYMTLSDTNCAAFEGLVITLHWNAGSCEWEGSTTITCDTGTYTVRAFFGCPSATNYQTGEIWMSDDTHADCFTVGDDFTAGAKLPCGSPFLFQMTNINLLFNDTASAGGCAKCCDNPFGQLTGTMTVTE
jgi:hypothetical protein